MSAQPGFLWAQPAGSFRQRWKKRQSCHSRMWAHGHGAAKDFRAALELVFLAFWVVCVWNYTFSLPFCLQKYSYLTRGQHAQHYFCYAPFGISSFTQSHVKAAWLPALQHLIARPEVSPCPPGRRHKACSCHVGTPWSRVQALTKWLPGPQAGHPVSHRNGEGWAECTMQSSLGTAVGKDHGFIWDNGFMVSVGWQTGKELSASLLPACWASQARTTQQQPNRGPWWLAAVPWCSPRAPPVS